MKFTKAAALAACLAAVPVLAACGSTSSGSVSQAAASNYSAVATSPAVLKAEQQAKDQVINPCKGKLPDVTGFKNCVEGKLGIQGSSQMAKDRRGSLEQCMLEAAAAEHAMTSHAGRLAFEQTGAPGCVSQILLASPGA